MFLEEVGEKGGNLLYIWSVFWVHFCLQCTLMILYIIFYIFINIRFAIRRLNKYILYAKGLSKGTQATQSVKWSEMYKWKDDMLYPGYEPEQLCATDISTLDHSATTI